MVTRRMGPLILVLVALVGLYAVVWAFLEKPYSGGGGKDAPDIGVKAAGKEVKLSEFKGKVVLLDFWATWCGPCRMSIPGIQRLYEKDKSKGFEVIGISKDEEDGPAIKAFITDLGMTYAAGLPIKKEMLASYESESIPYAVIVDKKGQVRWSQAGWSTGVEAEMEEMVEKLLKE